MIPPAPTSDAMATPPITTAFARSMRSYDLIEVTSPGYSKVPDDFLIAGWQDYPQKGYLCIVNVY